MVTVNTRIEDTNNQSSHTPAAIPCVHVCDRDMHIESLVAPTTTSSLQSVSYNACWLLVHLGMQDWVWFICHSNESSCFSNEIKADVVEAV